MFKLMGKEINAILGAQTFLIWTQVCLSIKMVLFFQNKGHNPNNSFGIPSKGNPLIIYFQLTKLSFKTVSLIVYEIFYLQGQVNQRH